MKTVSTILLKRGMALAMAYIVAVAAHAIAQVPGNSGAYDSGANPLNAQRRSAVVQGTRAASDVIWVMPSINTDPHNRGIHLPITLQNPNGRTICDPNSLQMTVAYNATVFFIRSVTRGTIVSKTLGHDSIYVTISFAGAAPVTDGVFTELVGDVLVGSEQSTTLDIVSLTCAGAPVTDSLQEGLLYLGPGFCENGSDRLLIYTDGLKINKIAPNPTRGAVTVNVTTMEVVETWLEVYAMNGNRVFATSWTPASEQESDMKREIVLPADIPSGTYRMVLRTPERSDVQSLIISK
ncbi:MAG TPA: hypothetical protein VHI13_05910 [Candidatus Kapabacteria bacterium]|nr:hypothetical protein [Candidatus Kapabacteria bacterium]